MRVLVLSDSHGRQSAAEEAISLHPEARTVIFLGDGERDIGKMKTVFTDREFLCVSGNNDFYSHFPDSALEIIGGRKIFFTHGHRQHVKGGDGALRELARSRAADILLYGHTHTPVTDYDDGLYVMNPGTLLMGQYGMVDITPSGIMCILASLR